ncbi:PREDICTED: V-set and immunoglobulin domain-containing protein 10 [Chaetura pelagica]|uniref:V-set and immunoglobulin domain-containing protein 10 n=1 Tax=Chaetura pelagica TaxID=8897 RepID=UPI000523C0F9|nr:PREDICTED: V-set and immunoglobulin domain-containing protein 10 [Chaetura pelagica]
MAAAPRSAPRALPAAPAPRAHWRSRRHAPLPLDRAQRSSASHWSRRAARLSPPLPLLWRPQAEEPGLALAAARINLLNHPGSEEVVFGQVGGSILLLCRNVSREATEVVWFQGDPHAFPPLFSSRVTFPPDVRFSLVDNSSLLITQLRLQDEGNYTCKEVLNKTDHEHRVQLLVGKTPSLETEPPKTCFVGDNVTLTCRVTESTPEAKLTWLRGIAQPEVEIQPGGRYLITQESNVSQLTIQNCSQGTDGGCYVCKAQNPLGLRELFVCLTVKQPVNIVGVVGAVVVLSLLAVLTITGLVLYYNPLLCLRGRSSPLHKPEKGAAFRSQDSDDVLVLVDSEDDDEGKEEEETLSSTKQEVMALVNGSSIQAAYQICLTGVSFNKVAPNAGRGGSQ